MNPCGSDAEPKPVWRDASLRLFSCPHCGLVWLDPLPATGSLYSDAYFDQYYEKTREVRRAYFEARLDELALPPGRLLDVGSGLGIFIDAAAQRGWRAHGVEPYAAARENVHRGTLDDAPFAAASFDLITFWDVLAHLPAPLAALRRARHLLAPEGTLVVKTPNRSRAHVAVGRLLGPVKGTRGWLHLPAQMFQFSPRSLRAMVEAAGFAEMRVAAAEEAVPSRWSRSPRGVRTFGEHLLRRLLRLAGEPESLILIARAGR
jgi:SAM-dependent methyltransferase